MTSIARAMLCSSAGVVHKRLVGDAYRCYVLLHNVTRLQSARSYSGGNALSKNPFEIQFHPDDEAKLFNKSSLTAASVLTPQETEIQDEIHILHAEMAGIFGEEPEEYDSNSSPSSEDDRSPAKDPQPEAHRTLEGTSFASAAASRLDNRRGNHAPSRPSILPQTRAVQVQNELDAPRILILQGPCSYVGDKAVGSNKPKHQFLSEIQSVGARLGAAVTCRDSNHEGEILDWLLGADAGSIIVLCWNAPLSESSMIIRALELLDSHAVAVTIVSPLGVEHGPLPASVRGVISGLDANAVEIAVTAVAQ